jgi:ABC-2 type transport system ATP-binding protein
MYADLTTGEYMTLAARLYGVRPDRTIAALGLGEHLHTRMTQLSSGFQRRLALAAALVADPDVLVLDAPTAGLDGPAAHDLRRYIREFMSGRTSLLCTHSASEAQELCDEIIVLRAGSVVAQGSLDELRRRGRARLRLAARQGAEALVAALEPAGLHGDIEENAVLVAVDDPETAAPGLLRRLLEAGLDVYECSLVRPTIDDLFREGLPR